MSKKSLIFIFLLPFFGFGQLSKIQKNEIVGFANHLLNIGSYQISIDFASSKLNSPNLLASQRDSLLFFIGIGYDKLKNDSLAEINYLKVSDSSSLFFSSKIIVAKKYISQTQFGKANNIIKNLPITDNESTNQLRYFLENGTGIMIGKDINRDSEKQGFSVLKPEFQKEITQLTILAKKKSKVKKRSPWIAGVLSGIIPGLGKVYAGSNAQGLATFIRVAILGGLTFENYYRHGVKNPQFWFFGSLTSIYYVGGIYGSVYLPKLNYQEKIDAINQNAKVGLLSNY